MEGLIAVVAVVVFVVIIIGGLSAIYYSDKKDATIKRLEGNQIFTASETGMYTFVGNAPVIIHTDHKGKVFYKEDTNEIIDGNNLIELGEL